MTSSEFDDDEVPSTSGLPAAVHSTPEHQPLTVLAKEAETLVITDVAVRSRAAYLFDQAETKRKDLTTEKTEKKKALDADIQRVFSQQIAALNVVDFELGLCKQISDYCRQKMTAFDREEIRKSQAEQARINKQIEDENAAAVRNAEVEGLAPPMLKAPEVVMTTPAKIDTGSATVGRKVFKNWTVQGGDMSGTQDEKKRKKALGELSDKDPRLAKLPRNQGLFLLNVDLIDSLVEIGMVPDGIIMFDDVAQTHRKKSSKAKG